MGWRAKSSQDALARALERGAKDGVDKADYATPQGKVASIYGIGDSLIYLMDNFTAEDRYEQMGFKKLEKPDLTESLGFDFIDHLTNNVEQGQMEKWSNFYKDIFGFYEVLLL